MQSHLEEHKHCLEQYSQTHIFHTVNKCCHKVTVELLKFDLSTKKQGQDFMSARNSPWLSKVKLLVRSVVGSFLS